MAKWPKAVRKAPACALTRSATGDSRNALLAADQRRGSPWNAGMVETSRAAALAARPLHQIADSRPAQLRQCRQTLIRQRLRLSGRSRHRMGGGKITFHPFGEALIRRIHSDRIKTIVFKFRSSGPGNAAQCSVGRTERRLQRGETKWQATESSKSQMQTSTRMF